MKAQTPQTFVVTPPPARAGWTLALLLLLPIIGIAVAYALPGKDGGPPVLMHGLLLATLAVAIRISTVSLRRRRLLLADGELTVIAGLFTQRINVTRLDLEHARIVNLDERTELRPFLKTAGVSLPGYHAGHFRLRGKLDKAFCLLTDRQRVLWLPLRDGKQQLLLSLQQPMVLLDALRELAPVEAKRH